MNGYGVLWIYIVLLVLGGLIGFLKAKSKISLYVSVGFAAVLALCAAAPFPRHWQTANIVQALLLPVFGWRLAKTKKFMPAGMMLVVTILALALENLLTHPTR